MRSNVNGVNRLVALLLATIWFCAAVVGMAVALVGDRLLFALLALFAMCYGMLWFRVFARKRLVRWSELAFPWRIR